MTSTTSNKNVTFNPKVTGVEIMSIYDYTASEISAAWFDADEMDQITKRCLKLIRRMQNEAPSATKKYCTRGLEGHTRIGSVCKKKNRAISIAAVLREQSNQWIDNRVDEQAIADVYQKTTLSCQNWSQVMGKRDQEAAEAIVLQDRLREVQEGMNANDRTAFPTKSTLQTQKSKRVIPTRRPPSEQIFEPPSGARAA